MSVYVYNCVHPCTAYTILHYTYCIFLSFLQLFLLSLFPSLHISVNWHFFRPLVRLLSLSLYHMQTRSRGAARRPPSRRALRASGSGSDPAPSDSLTSSLDRPSKEAPPPALKKKPAAAPPIPVAAPADPFPDLVSEPVTVPPLRDGEGCYLIPEHRIVVMHAGKGSSWVQRRVFIIELYLLSLSELCSTARVLQTFISLLVMVTYLNCVFECTCTCLKLYPVP